MNPVAGVEEDGDGGEDDQRPLVNLTIITDIMEGHIILCDHDDQDGVKRSL